MDDPSRNNQGEGLQERRGNIGAVWRNILWPVHPPNAHLADLVCSERHMFGPFSIHNYRCLSGFSEISRFLGLWTKNVNRCIYSNRRQDNLLKKNCTLWSRAGKRSKTQCQCFSKDWAFYQDITGGLWFIYIVCMFSGHVPCGKKSYSFYWQFFHLLIISVPHSLPYSSPQYDDLEDTCITMRNSSVLTARGQDWEVQTPYMLETNI